MTKAPTPFQIVGKAAKGVGKMIAAPFKWAGGQIEKEMKMDKAKDDKYRVAGSAMNQEYSGFKYGYQPRKKK